MNDQSDGFDSKPEKLYNSSIEPDFSQPIKIDMSQQTPLNDSQCEHDFFLDDSDADSSWTNVYRCKKCPAGHLTAK